MMRGLVLIIGLIAVAFSCQRQQLIRIKRHIEPETPSAFPARTEPAPVKDTVPAPQETTPAVATVTPDELKAEPTAEAPKVEEPKVEAPKAAEPKVEQTKAEQPKADTGVSGEDLYKQASEAAKAGQDKKARQLYFDSCQKGFASACH